MSETNTVYQLTPLVFPKAKIQHILFEGTNTGYGMTIYSILSDDRKSVTYSYSVFNPNDRQFKKSIGREVAIEHFLRGNRKEISLTNLSPFMFSAKAIMFLILWDILSTVQEENRKNSSVKRSRRFIRDLRDQVFQFFMSLNIFSRELI